MILKRTIQYKIGDEVVLKVEPTITRVVTGYTLREKAITYILAGPELNESWHQGIEITKTQQKKAGFR